MLRLFLTAALVAAFSWPVQAAPLCGPRAGVVKMLLEKYAEAPVGRGVTNRGALIEIFATSSGSTWSFMLTTPAGLSCLYDAGENWRVLEPEWPLPGEPS